MDYWRELERVLFFNTRCADTVNIGAVGTGILSRMCVYACVRDIKRLTEVKKLAKLNYFPDEVQNYYKMLKPKQRTVAEALVNPDDERSIKELCDEVGISRTTFYNWQKQPEFTGYVKVLIECLTSSCLPKAWKQISKKIDKGDMEAIRMLFELKGELSGGNSNNQNVVIFTGEDVKP